MSIGTYLERMLTAMPDLVASHEIAQMLGVSRQRVDQLAAKADFPKPVAVLKVGRIWRTEDVAAWAREHGRTVAED